MLNTYIYHQLPPTCFGVGYTIFRDTSTLLAQTLYAFRNCKFTNLKNGVYFTFCSTTYVTTLQRAECLRMLHDGLPEDGVTNNESLSLHRALRRVT